MKIIFDSKKEKKEIVNVMARSELCPKQIGLPYDCREDCNGCWEKALEKIEVRKNEI